AGTDPKASTLIFPDPALELGGAPPNTSPLRVDEAHFDADARDLVEHQGLGGCAVLQIDPHRPDPANGPLPWRGVDLDGGGEVLPLAVGHIIRGAERTEGETAVGLGRGRVPIASLHRIGGDGLASDRPFFRVD